MNTFDLRNSILRPGTIFLYFILLLFESTGAYECPFTGTGEETAFSRYVQVKKTTVFPSAIVNTENTQVAFSAILTPLQDVEIEQVTIDLSPLLGAGHEADILSFDDGTWACTATVGQGLKVKKYSLAIHIETTADSIPDTTLVSLEVADMQGSGTISPANSYIRYHGRMDTWTNPTAPNMGWHSNAVEARFKGTGIKARINCDNDFAWCNAIIDGDQEHPVELDMVYGDHTYTIKTGLSDTFHTLFLFRRSEVGNSMIFLDLELDPGCGLLPAQTPSGRKIEFYGDSITSGYNSGKAPGVDDTSDTWYSNNYLAYGAITARALDAEYSCISQGGLTLTKGNGEIELDDLYDQTTHASADPVWDFSRWQADVVVVNIFENDYWRWKSDPPDESFFVTEYKNFITTLRGKYPEAHIFCILGSMGVVSGNPSTDIYHSAIIDVVSQLNSAGDDRVYYKFLPYMNDPQILADEGIPYTPGHPAAWHHQHIMADVLVPFIREKTGW